MSRISIPIVQKPLLKRLLEQQTTGAIMSAVPKAVFGNLLVPDVPKDKQQRVTGLVREYFKLRKKARELVQETLEN